MTLVHESDRRHALQPVRTQLIRRAQHDAEAVLAAARTEAAAQVASAEARAVAILDQIRAQRAARAAAETAAKRSSARRRARAVELDAERAVYAAARDGVERGVLALRDAPEYRQLRDALERRARELIGPRARLSEDPRGGVVATAPGRRVDLSLPVIAARALDGLGEEVSRLWTLDEHGDSMNNAATP